MLDIEPHDSSFFGPATWKDIRVESTCTDPSWCKNGYRWGDRFVSHVENLQSSQLPGGGTGCTVDSITIEKG